MATEARRLRVPAHVRAREIDGEIVVLDLSRGEYFGLDGVGARLWVALASGLSVEEAAREMLPDYAVRDEQLLSDLRTLGDELIARGLMEEIPRGLP